MSMPTGDLLDPGIAQQRRSARRRTRTDRPSARSRRAVPTCPRRRPPARATGRRAGGAAAEPKSHTIGSPPAGEQAVARHLVADAPPIQVGDVADVVEVEEQHGAEGAALERVARARARRYARKRSKSTRVSKSTPLWPGVLMIGPKSSLMTSLANPSSMSLFSDSNVSPALRAAREAAPRSLRLVSGADRARDDLSAQRRDGHRHTEVFASSMPRSKSLRNRTGVKLAREFEVHERRSLVASECRAHHRVVQELEERTSFDAAASRPVR